VAAGIKATGGPSGSAIGAAAKGPDQWLAAAGGCAALAGMASGFGGCGEDTGSGFGAAAVSVVIAGWAGAGSGSAGLSGMTWGTAADAEASTTSIEAQTGSIAPAVPRGILEWSNQAPISRCKPTTESATVAIRFCDRRAFTSSKTVLNSQMKHCSDPPPLLVCSGDRRERRTTKN